jgi:hypothetical protein
LLQCFAVFDTRASVRLAGIYPPNPPHPHSILSNLEFLVRSRR